MLTQYSKISTKTLEQKIDVIAHYHAHNIQPKRIAYRTGIDIKLVDQLINGTAHACVFKKHLFKHRKTRRDQRLNKSLKIKGIAQAALQDQIEHEYVQSIKT